MWRMTWCGGLRPTQCNPCASFSREVAKVYRCWAIQLSRSPTIKGGRRLNYEFRRGGILISFLPKNRASKE
jgi:hypothetical protein